MINKFKDFLNKITRRKKTSEVEYDHTGEVEIPNDFSAEVIDEDTNSENDSAPELPPPSLEDRTPRPTRLPKLNFTRPNFSEILERVKFSIGNFAQKIRFKPREFKVDNGAWKQSQLSKKLASVDWGGLADKVLAPDSRTPIHRAFMMVLILGSAWSAGKLAGLFLKGPPAMEASPRRIALIDTSNEFRPSELMSVKAQNPFKSVAGETGKKPLIATAKCESSDVRSSLPIKLVNTIVLQDAVKSLASVQVRSGRELEEVREGDEISGMARVGRISRLEMFIRNLQTGTCEVVASEKQKELRKNLNVMSPAASRSYKAEQKRMKGIENQGNKFSISKELLDEKLKDISSVLTQARAIKIQNPDGTLAFKITEIDPGGIFSYLGIQDQDIITSINGKPITDLNEIMSLFGRLKNLDQLQLGVKREGEETNLDYAMKK